MKWKATLFSFCSQCRRRLRSNENFYWIFLIKRYAFLGFQCFMKILGPTMFALAVTLILSVFVGSLLFVLPDIPSLPEKIFHVVMGTYLFVNVLFNYLLCVFTSPGAPPPCDDPGPLLGETTINMNGQRVHAINSRLDIAPAVSYRYCRVCCAIKPPRAHHDSVTGKCVYHMDHYCPWMNNCIGFYNYRYFVLFLVYITIGAFYVSVLTFHGVYESSISTSSLGFWEKAAVQTALFTIAAAACLAAGILLAWHSFLCFSNQTTIEFYINMAERHEASKVGGTFRNPFDKGWRKNLTRVFGDVPWYRAGLMSLRQPPAPEYPLLIEDYLEFGGSNILHV